MRKKDETISEYALSVCDVKQEKAMSQVQVGRKENEISKAPEALKLLKIDGKVVTGDAMHTQKGYPRKFWKGTGILCFLSKKIKAGCTKVFRNSLPLNVQDRASEKSRSISRLLRR
jgi:predicted transposase YbfD/YdcC